MAQPNETADVILKITYKKGIAEAKQNMEPSRATPQRTHVANCLLPCLLKSQVSSRRTTQKVHKSSQFPSPFRRNSRLPSGTFEGLQRWAQFHCLAFPWAAPSLGQLLAFPCHVGYPTCLSTGQGLCPDQPFISRSPVKVHFECCCHEKLLHSLGSHRFLQLPCPHGFDASVTPYTQGLGPETPGMGQDGTVLLLNNLRP